MDQDRKFSSCHRFARISPRKVRYVIDLIRGLPVERALDDLRFSTKRATPMISKVIRSALANATQEAGLETSNLYIAQALVDVGPRIKRFKPRAMGRAYPRLRRTCHISVVLREMDPQVQKAEKEKKASREKGKEKAKEKGRGGPEKSSVKTHRGKADAAEAKAGPEPKDEAKS